MTDKRMDAQEPDVVEYLRPSLSLPNRVQVGLRSGRVLVVDERLLLSLSVVVGGEVSQETLERLAASAEKTRALEAALRLLANRLHSEGEIRQKLARRGFSPESVSLAVRELTDSRHLDDERFSGLYADEGMRRRKKGPVRLRVELRRKGVEDTVVERVISRTIDQKVLLGTALDIATRKFATMVGTANPLAVKRKLYTYLKRRGYEHDMIMDVINRVLMQSEAE